MNILNTRFYLTAPVDILLTFVILDGMSSEREVNKLRIGKVVMKAGVIRKIDRIVNGAQEVI